MMKRAFLMSFAALFAVSAAQADSQVRPLAEVGAGMETAIGNGGINVLLRVRAGVRWTSDGSDIPGLDQLILAHIDGQLAVNPDDGSGDRIPYMNIRFIPVANPQDIPNPDGSGQRLQIQLLPTTLHRDTRIGRNFGVSVGLVGLEIGVDTLLSREVGFFLNVAVDLLGWKIIEQNGGYGTFQGLHIANAGIELGLVFNIAEAFHVRISAGVQADLNLGEPNRGWALQSDHEAYARLAVEITRFIQLYARLSIRNHWDSGFSDRTVYQFMAGLNIIFM